MFFVEVKFMEEKIKEIVIAFYGLMEKNGVNKTQRKMFIYYYNNFIRPAVIQMENNKEETIGDLIDKQEEMSKENLGRFELFKKNELELLSCIKTKLKINGKEITYKEAFEKILNKYNDIID